MTPATATHDVLSRVRAGVAWLGANIPDWLERIDEDGLCMCDTHNCILGQLDGGFNQSCLNRNLNTWETVDLGFFSPREDYAEIYDAWRSEILRLREERKTP
jgi:hypothetical protein